MITELLAVKMFPAPVIISVDTSKGGLLYVTKPQGFSQPKAPRGAGPIELLLLSASQPAPAAKRLSQQRAEVQQQQVALAQQAQELDALMATQMSTPNQLLGQFQGPEQQLFHMAVPAAQGAARRQLYVPHDKPTGA